LSIFGLIVGGYLGRIKAIDLGIETTFQATPIVVDGILYLATVYGRVIALKTPTPAPRSGNTMPGSTRRSSYTEGDVKVTGFPVRADS
jgi:hypothetical protein